jgi:hypothetical protein
MKYLNEKIVMPTTENIITTDDKKENKIPHPKYVT